MHMFYFFESNDLEIAISLVITNVLQEPENTAYKHYWCIDDKIHSPRGTLSPMSNTL